MAGLAVGFAARIGEFVAQVVQPVACEGEGCVVEGRANERCDLVDFAAASRPRPDVERHGVLAAAIQSQTGARTTLPANPAPPPIIAAVRTAPSS